MNKAIDAIIKVCQDSNISFETKKIAIEAILKLYFHSE